MEIKREQGRFVLIENAEFSFPIAFYMREIDKIAICYGRGDRITASQVINKLFREQNFLDKCKSFTE